MITLPGMRTRKVVEPRSPGELDAMAVAGSLVQQIRNQADRSVTVTSESATGKVGFLRAARGGDLLPSVEGDSARAAQHKADAYLRQYAAAFGARQPPDPTAKPRTATLPVRPHAGTHPEVTNGHPARAPSHRNPPGSHERSPCPSAGRRNPPGSHERPSRPPELPPDPAAEPLAACRRPVSRRRWPQSPPADVRPTVARGA